MAADYDPDPRELSCSVRRQLEQTLLADANLLRRDPDYEPVTAAVDIPGNYGELAELDDDSS